MAAARPYAVAASDSAMPGATVARLVSCAWEMAAKLDMMPQTVPKRSMNGATEEMTARLGSPPSDRVKSSRAARAIASEMRALNSLTVSPAMRRRTSSSPAAATLDSSFAMPTPARASRTARRMRVTEITPSMISTQHHSEATNSTAMTALPTRPASRKSPTGDRSIPCMRRLVFPPGAISRASHRISQPAIDRERHCWPQAPRIGQVGRGVRQRSRVEQAAVGIIVLVEYVLDEAVDLQLLANLEGGVRAEDSVAGDLRKRPVLVAEK